MNDTCPVCQSHATEYYGGGDWHRITCLRCGEFERHDHLPIESFFPDLSHEQRAYISSGIRELAKPRIDLKLFEKLKNAQPPRVGEKAEKLLQHMAEQNPRTGGQFMSPGGNFHHKKDVLLAQSTAWILDEREHHFLFFEYLHKEKQFLLPSESENKFFIISPKGWAYLDSLRQANPRSQIGFVAMWFDPKLTPLYEQAICPAILGAGYEPKIINQHEHNNKIDDEIIAMIRRSKFVVADFSGLRPNVYYEAGFARGLGLEVFCLCKKEELDKIAFDTRQYIHLEWEENQFDNLKQKLQKKIEAKFGVGSYSASKSN